MRSVIQSVEAYRMATHLFVDRYGHLPGDHPHARETIAPYLRNGNGNGLIEGSPIQESEAYAFWQHLGAAGLIAHPGRVADHQPVAFGHGVPGAKTGGGFTVVSAPPGMDPTGKAWLRLGNRGGDDNGRALLTPLKFNTS